MTINPTLDKERKGILLAGGTGSRLFPITLATSKQLLPLYDKPMIYYPLTTLMLAGVKEILIITTPLDNESFKRLLGDGSQWGLKIEYAIQKKPEGLAQSFHIAAKFLDQSSSILILGDNFFHGDDLSKKLQAIKNNGATVFAYPVNEPERYGVPEFDKKGNIVSLEEKPKMPKSNYAITGLYFFDETVVEKSFMISPSKRGELEINDINKIYLSEGKLNVISLNRGNAWLDTGTFDSLLAASSYISTLENRQGLKIGCPEEVSWRMGFINDEQLEKLASKLIKSGYGKYLLRILKEKT